jgi:hypothetical protein
VYFSDAYTELLTGELKEGDSVVLNPATDTDDGMRMFMMGGGGGRPPDDNGNQGQSGGGGGGGQP